MKENLYKTKDVADQLNVSAGTVLKWVKKHDIPYSVNQYGHYCFEEKHLPLFNEIKEQNRQLVSTSTKKEPPVTTNVLTEKITDMEDKIKILERLVSSKADDIVSFQLMEHRKEVRSVSKQLQKIEDRLYKLEDKKETWAMTELPKQTKKDKRVLTSILSAMRIM
ncbi:helix-turn-helix domain-containing protein [Alteribacillus sp. YIM 98480]|uniref:helix-turn-helix domain-containing protein n=1 Tax=Alteribacillus sp. YIM 98480 TaxID=2606599 RepID=UPI00131DA8AA|nr:helix-turn-helix domain-containing protein [Alteribacillus sp. YIM 98480]